MSVTQLRPRVYYCTHSIRVPENSQAPCHSIRNARIRAPLNILCLQFHGHSQHRQPLQYRIMHSPQDSQKARSRGTTFAKRALVGNTAGRVPPSWKSSTQDRLTKQKPINENTGEVVTRRNASHFPRVGSKILMGQLPADSVSERDIEVRMQCKGPLFLRADPLLLRNSLPRQLDQFLMYSLFTTPREGRKVWL